MESLNTKKRGRPIRPKNENNIHTIKNILNVSQDSISKNTEIYKKSITEELAELEDKEFLETKQLTIEELYDYMFNNKLQPLPKPPTKEELLKYSGKLDLESLNCIKK